MIPHSSANLAAIVDLRFFGYSFVSLALTDPAFDLRLLVRLTVEVAPRGVFVAGVRDQGSHFLAEPVLPQDVGLMLR